MFMIAVKSPSCGVLFHRYMLWCCMAVSFLRGSGNWSFRFHRGSHALVVQQSVGSPCTATLMAVHRITLCCSFNYEFCSLGQLVAGVGIGYVLCVRKG